MVLDNLYDFVPSALLGPALHLRGRPPAYELRTHPRQRRARSRHARVHRGARTPRALLASAGSPAFWSRSFIRESLWAVLRLPLRRPALWLSLAELTSWLLLTGTLLVTMFVAPALGTKVTVTTCIAYARLRRSSPGSLGPVVRCDDTGRGPASAARDLRHRPLYAVLHVFLLLPLRFVALATLRTTSWGTRKVVEVRLRHRPTL